MIVNRNKVSKPAAMSVTKRGLAAPMANISFTVTLDGKPSGQVRKVRAAAGSVQ